MSGARVIGIGLLALSLVCGIVSTAIDYWYYGSVTVYGQTHKVYYGLWEVCEAVHNESKCTSWRSLEDNSGDASHFAWIHACQAMMIIGVVGNAAVCGAAIYATVKPMPPRITQGVAAVAAVAGVCYLIASAIFVAKYEKPRSIIDGQTVGNLHAGFGLAIVAGLSNLVSTCVLARGQAGGSYEHL